MRIFLRAALFIAAYSLLPAAASAQLIPSANGQTVYDVHLHVRWLANANLAGTSEGKTIASNAKITAITPGGSMHYGTAIEWLNALNTMTNADGSVGYQGHTTWTLPTSPVDPSNPPDPNPVLAVDTGCTSIGPDGDRFGYNCTIADMAGLYNLKQSLGLLWPNSPLPVSDIQTYPFHNFQPYLYWTSTADTGTGHGFHTFSFNTGFAGSNTNSHYMYVLPVIKGRVVDEYDHTVQVNWVPSGVGALEVSTDGTLVYDPAPTDVTFLADANLAKSHAFGAQCGSYAPPENSAVFPPGIPCIAADGSMANNTAGDTTNPNSWISGMNYYMGTGWLGRQDWQLPEDPDECGNYGCIETAMGDLYYNQLQLPAGTPIVRAFSMEAGPFNHVQPYLYWSCGAPVTNPPCQTVTPPASTQEWSFSFGNGFQGTDLKINDLYVMIYFEQTPAQALLEAIGEDLATSLQRNAFLAQANSILHAPKRFAKAGAIGAFINYVNAQRGMALTTAQANELIMLAKINY